ncbi:hypothetical protein [Ruminococcus albus]|uniref:Lipoprotein n=1 Tax=Ruminococcus albus TaxID=1264 RepID=A0A1I1PNJ9_RUMAL|nr:hypothetical protein [Ruminococcus albus]SFD11469.1 hypothetical protein SAMN02910406_03131 [Ruminococcus albus]
MKFRSLSLTAVLMAVLLFGGCAFFDFSDVSSDEADHSFSRRNNEGDGLYYSWDGGEITSEIAEENGCVMKGSTDSVKWKDFLINVNSSEKAEVTVCSEDSVMLISESGTGSTALISVKQKDGDEVVETSRVVSPVEVCCIYNDTNREMEYYLSDILLNTVPASNNEGYHDIPVTCTNYRVSSTAAITFPYQRYFSSYTEFVNYCDKYHEILGLENVMKDMKAFEDNGGFNTNVVFLYGDRSGGAAEYEFLHAVESDRELTIYMKRKYSDNKDIVSKWQLTCTVPGQYLSDVAPDAVRWVIYDDEVARG